MFRKIALLASLVLAVTSPSSTTALPTAREVGCSVAAPTKCFTEGTRAQALPLAYQRSRSVALVRTGIGRTCTGFLIGSEGHFITWPYCIYDPAITQISFDAESTTCEDRCFVSTCRGTVVTTNSTEIATSLPLGYTIVKLPSSLDLKKYGYLQLRGSGPVVGEAVYMPHQSFEVGSAGKRIADTGTNGPATVTTVNGTNTWYGATVGYTLNSYSADISFGAPVLAASDNLVVAVHYGLRPIRLPSQASIPV